MKYRENTDFIVLVLIISLQREQRGKNTKRNKMIAGETQTNHENLKSVSPKGNTKSSAKKPKTEISHSFLQRIISLLKKEELI
ncbi:hypothetical protein EG347_12015 [Chryseobacterium sp. G0186]|uniref:hypothetical protein n=1 Tax=Chryseobacterium sp. G0186 TaxID=2487064 RepID=UPI000F4E8E5E|nr:hypothetical protein [Chryseobacterium sp. G0186]AZA78189.1 hypothetical protein EG347_12015 [Chryseobacterium sp. G0186]